MLATSKITDADLALGVHERAESWFGQEEQITGQRSGRAQPNKRLCEEGLTNNDATSLSNKTQPRKTRTEKPSQITEQTKWIIH